MAQDTMIRKAKKDYVCEGCGHIIRTGEEYLDRAVFVYGKMVRHERYHDECPHIDAVQTLFARIVASGGELLATNKDGTKIHVIGVAYKSYKTPVILYREWLSNKKLAMDLISGEDYIDVNGHTLV